MIIVGETILQIRNRNADSITVLITDYIDYGPREFFDNWEKVYNQYTLYEKD